MKIKDLKKNSNIKCLTAYTAPIAKLIDDYVDVILVGDSVGMVLYGLESTVQTTMRMMIDHGRAVSNNSKKSIIIVDMPFGTYANKNIAYKNAVKIMQQTNADGVKIEANNQSFEIIEFLSDNGIPVMAHIGLLPQSIKKEGIYRIYGKDQSEKKYLIDLAKNIDNSGAFSIVLECIEHDIAAEITEKIKIPTIGIGSGKKCDGQILVTEDLLGLHNQRLASFIPKGKKLYADMEEIIKKYYEDF